MFSFLKYWIPLAIAITLTCGLIYVAVQQDLRQGANDPQIQISEDLANSFAQGQDPANLTPSSSVDLSKSSALFVVVFDASQKVLVSTATLDGQTPNLPRGILDFAKSHKQNRLTWQPKPDVREATVITYFNDKQEGYVLVGRSLKLTEERVERLTKEIGLGYFVIMFLTFAASFLLALLPIKKSNRK